MVSAHKGAFGICRKNPGPLEGFLPTGRFGPHSFGKGETLCWWRGWGLWNPRLLWLSRRGPASLHTTQGRRSSSCRQLALSLPSLASVYSILRMMVARPYLCLTLSLTLKQLLVGHVVRPGARALLTGTFLSSICSDVQDSEETLALK